MKLKMAVVGKDVSESLSPKMHTFIMNKLGVDITYDKVSIDPVDFKAKFPCILSEYDTLNITIPYKLDVIPYMNELKEDGKIFMSINTIDCRTKFGYNTDGAGFMLMISLLNLTIGIILEVVVKKHRQLFELIYIRNNKKM